MSQTAGGGTTTRRSPTNTGEYVWTTGLVKSLKKIRWFRPDKTPLREWKLFLIGFAALNAAKKAARNAPAAIDSARFAAFNALKVDKAPDWKSAWEVAGARRGEMAWEAFKNSIGEKL